ncbi:MAG: c-type cytochrome, partial [Ignavibacteria bacterium]
MAERNLIFLMWCAGAMMTMFSGCSGRNGSTTAAMPKGGGVATTDSSSQAAEIQPARPLTYEQRQGKFLFMKYCAVCHGDDGKGDGFNAFNLDPKPRNFTDTTLMKGMSDERIEQTIRGGGRSVNKSHLMPSW